MSGDLLPKTQQTAVTLSAPVTLKFVVRAVRKCVQTGCNQMQWTLPQKNPSSSETSLV